MLECRACLWSCLRAICPELPSSALAGAVRPSRRLHARTAGRVAVRHISSVSLNLRERRRGPVKTDNTIIEAVKSRPAGLQKLPEGITTTQFRRLKLEVPWLAGDRLKLLRRTKDLLKDGRHPEALELVRLASKTQPCTIAWNALLEDLMGQKKVNTAFKVYNDMKKRGQLPDSYTYSTLFNGLTANSKTPSVGTKAVALWQSLTSPNSKIKPSILLTNAALKACASAGDMDAVWAIAGAIPDQGAEAADSITYTTIFNAMRFSTELQVGREATEEQQRALDTVIAQSRQIWVDVITRWTSARLTLDEDLVCAMGRLMLAGIRPQDWDDIFSLCAQTMNITRQVPRLKARDSAHNPASLYQPPAPFGQSDRTIAAASADVDASTGREFSPVATNRSVWIKPTNQTLTLLVEACQKMFVVRAAEQYWKLLTSPEQFAIKPDSVSLHAYLRLLRQTRASADTVRFVRDEMKDERPAPKTFRIAMSTCMRNQFSQNAMREATELMDLMLTRLRGVDLKTGIRYMKLAVESPHAQDTLVALGYMTPQRTNLWDVLNKGSEVDKEALLELAKLVVSGFDRVIYVKKEKTGSDEHSIEEYQKRKATWTYAVQRLLGGGERVKPTMSDEELTLMAKKKALSRFERKKGRDRMRVKRQGSRAVVVEGRKRDEFPALESDTI